MSRLVDQVEAVVKESGNLNGFDLRSWLIRWLYQPIPALERGKPVAQLGTPAGRKVVSDLLLRVQHGVFV